MDDNDDDDNDDDDDIDDDDSTVKRVGRTPRKLDDEQKHLDQRYNARRASMDDVTRDWTFGHLEDL